MLLVASSRVLSVMESSDVIAVSVPLSAFDLINTLSMMSRKEERKRKEKPETKSPAPGGAGGHRQGKSAFDGKKSYDRVGSTPVSAETQHG